MHNSTAKKSIALITLLVTLSFACNSVSRFVNLPPTNTPVMPATFTAPAVHTRVAPVTKTAPAAATRVAPATPTAASSNTPAATKLPANAVVVRVFSDFQCPYCKEFAVEIESQIIKHYSDTPRVVVEVRHFIVIDLGVGGNESRHAAEASECAREQGKFWQYHDALFAHQGGEGQGAFKDQNLEAFAADIGLDTAAFNQCFEAGRYAKKIQADEALGRSLGVSGTPTVFVDDQPVQNPFDLKALQGVIDAELAKSK